MTQFIFPQSVYDVPSNLLAVLGSWWVDEYSGKDQLHAYAQAKAQVEQQTVLDTMELIASLSRFSVPIYHRDNWYPLYLLKSEQNNAQTSLARYDDGSTYGDGTYYDVPTMSPFYAFPKPEGLETASVMMNRFTDPTLILSENVDYLLNDTAIIFRSSPFDDARIAKRPVYKDGQQVDTEAVIWIYRGEWDWDTIYRQFAYVLGMRLKSSQGYRDIMNAVYDATIGGAVRGSVLNALSAMTGVPLVTEAVETVEVITADSDNLLIITDQHVYKFDLTATPIVAVGDTVTKGESLTDTIRVYELNCGATPDTVRSLCLGKGYLSSCFYSDIIFENREVPLQVDAEHVSGYTKVSWGLGGFPLDVDRFFDELHERGVEEASREIDDCETTDTITYPVNNCDEQGTVGRYGTLAHLLDTRDTRVGEPTSAHLPRTINPLKFLVENVLRNNACIVQVQASAASNGVGLHNMRLLQKVIPPHTATILMIDVAPQSDAISVNNITQQVTTFTGMEPLSDTINTVSDSRITIRVVSGTCQ